MISRNFLPSISFDAPRPLFPKFWFGFSQILPLQHHISRLSTRLSSLHRRQTPTKNRRHPRQVVRGESERRLRRDFGKPDKARLTQSADRLAPAENFLDQFALLHAHLVTRMARRTGVDGAVLFLCHVRRDPQSAHGKCQSF
jgi:hypothetical protein